MKILLLDMDGPLAQFDEHLITLWKQLYPDLPFVPMEQRTTFYVEDDYPEDLRQKVRGIYQQQGFFRDLPPTPGALGSIRYMDKYIQDKVSLFFCTSPIRFYEYCVTEKYQWIEKHLGPSFTRRIILTSDKTLVRGDYLVDDKPEITGEMTPTWEHIVFDMPYNKTSTKRRLSWSNWQWFLEELFK